MDWKGRNEASGDRNNPEGKDSGLEREERAHGKETFRSIVNKRILYNLIFR